MESTPRRSTPSSFGAPQASCDFADAQAVHRLAVDFSDDVTRAEAGLIRGGAREGCDHDRGAASALNLHADTRILTLLLVP
jgi:hypothetical protein